MKENTLKFVRSAKNGAGKALMVLSLVGMMGMNVSAANGRELSDINKDVNVSRYNLNLNANGRIEYDKNLDGNKEVFYDYLDYQKLAESLETINENEKELQKEYQRLYDLAEQNRKDLIAEWNAKFNPHQQIDPNTGTYVTGEGTKSLKGAIHTMPVHQFNEITFSYDVNTGKVTARYPEPAWGFYNGGAIDTGAIEKLIKDAYNRGYNDGYSVGVGVGIDSTCMNIEKINVWDGVATADRSYTKWDDAAGGQANGVSVFLQDKDKDVVAQGAIDYCYGLAAGGGNVERVFEDTTLANWSRAKIADHYYEYTHSVQNGNLIYKGIVRVVRGDVEGHTIGDKDKYHISNVYVTVSRAQ